MNAKEAHSLELVAALKKKRGRFYAGQEQPKITSKRIHLERLTKKAARRLQRIAGGSVKLRYNGIGDYVWKVEGARNIDRVLSILISTDAGREYFEKNCPDAGSDRWREYNLD